jgi:TadE-like protein
VRARKQPGQAVVELALASTVLLWFALGSLDFGRVFYTSLGLTNAAREGARLAAAQGGAPCPATVPSSLVSQTRSVVRAEQSGLFPASVPDSVITVSCSTNDRWTVTITGYPFHPIAPFIANALGDGAVVHLSTSATMPVVTS